MISDVLDSGVLLSKALPGGTESLMSTCSTNNFIPGSFTEEINQKYFDKERLRKEILAECLGKNSCDVILNSARFFRIPKEHRRPNHVLFFQASCTQMDGALELKNQRGLLIACLGLFMWLFYQFSIKLLQNNCKIYAT